ncbi:MAG TPA: TIGR03767 family metallophosphoesterase [Jatrophihabitans sp.]|nr:TIGR03767 family metallophosphoesterase [Jatrophihabitans sp.]
MSVRSRIVGGPVGPLGYRPLQRTGPEPYTVRDELAPGDAALDGIPAADAVEVLATMVHLSDLHVCDAQSPARVEFLDRLADPDSPIHDEVGEVGTYRAQEILTVQVVAAMVASVNRLRRGPGFGAAIDLALVTGDNTDNAQANELAWYLGLLDGGTVTADSGDRNRFEGVAAQADPHYWLPEVTGADRAQACHGFPAVAGLLEAVRRPVSSPGLAVPWLAVHGNHDQLLQGTVPASGALGEAAVGTRKPVGFEPQPEPAELLPLLAGLASCEPAALARLAGLSTVPVTADHARRIITRAEFTAAHQRPGARPAGHGFGADGRPYYRHDLGRVSILVLDTVDEFGGWQGSLDREQAGWLDVELASADAEQRYAVLASHHSLDTLVNDANGPGLPDRVLSAELQAMLAGHPSLILWLNGHTHATRATPRQGYWELTAPSLIDWPQQGRVVELARQHDRLLVVTTMIDHDGAAPWDGTIEATEALAGLSRELAANDWQWRAVPLEQHPRAGTPGDRELILALPDPWASGPVLADEASRTSRRGNRVS